MSEAPEFAPESLDEVQDDTPVEGVSEQTESSESQPESSPSNEGGLQQESPKDNPAWNDVLGKVPESFHSPLKEYLSKQDKAFQELQQGYSGYKAFRENNVSPEVLAQGLQLIQAFQQNPRAIYDYLTQAYNFGAQQQAQQQTPKEQEEQLELGDEQKLDISKDPRFQQVANQAEIAQQMIVQMQQQQLEAQMNQQVDAEIKAIESHMQYKHIPMDMIITHALGKAATQQARTGREVPADIMQSAKELWETGRFSPKTRVPAPPNLSGRRGSSQPAEAEPEWGKMSRSQRTAAIAAMMREHEND